MGKTLQYFSIQHQTNGCRAANDASIRHQNVYETNKVDNVCCQWTTPGCQAKTDDWWRPTALKTHLHITENITMQRSLGGGCIKRCTCLSVRPSMRNSASIIIMFIIWEDRQQTAVCFVKIYDQLSNSKCTYTVSELYHKPRLFPNRWKACHILSYSLLSC